MKYDDLLEKIGEFGTYQKRLCILVLLATLPLPWFIISPAYVQYKTEFSCRGYPELYQNGTELGNSQENQNTNIYKTNTCKINKSDVLNESSLNNSSSNDYLYLCDSGWNYEDNNTVIAEFNLVCNDSWKPALALTLYMAGMAVGASSGTLSDRFGRRPIYLFFVFFQYFIAGITGFAINFEMYAICMFLLGTCGFVAYNISVTTMSEMVVSRRHDAMMFLILTSWCIGFIISSLIAFLSQNWRWYLRSCSLVGLIYVIPLWRMFPESLRWQIVSGKTEEAKRSILMIANMNRKIVDVEDLFSQLQVTEDTEKEQKLNKTNNNFFRACIDSAAIRNRSITMTICWTVSLLLYFSISLNPITPQNSRFVHVIIVGLAELPGYIFGYFLSKYFGGCWCCAISIGLGGIICLIIPFLYASSPVFLSVATFFGKCFISSSYGYAIIVIAQVTPTLMRSTAIGFASLCGKIGGLAMPYLMLLGDTQTPTIPFFTMGSLGLFSAVLVVLFIPNTRTDIPDTVQDAEANKSNYLQIICKKLRSPYRQGHQTECNDREIIELIC